MEISAAKRDFEKLKTDFLVCGFFEDYTPPESEDLKKKFNLDRKLGSLSFTGKFKDFSVIPVGEEVKNVAALGLGKKGEFTFEKLRVMYSKAVSQAKTLKQKKVSLLVPGVLNPGRESYELSYISRITEYQFDEFKSEKNGNGIEHLEVLSDQAYSEEVNKGDIVGKSTNFTRSLANMPASNGTPSFFEKEVKGIPNLKITVLSREDFLKLGMGGLEGVSRAATEPAKLIIAEYKNSDEAPILLVGKGITFDSGGISIKPSEKMDEMKFDKCGASAVLGAIKAISELKLKTHVVAMTPLTENLPGGNAYKPGDILRHYNGKTSEILSTDAEGRLVLADALAYGVEKFNPRAVVDLATLTGACVVALGNNIAGTMTNNEDLQNKLFEASKNSWEKLWPLPLDEDFKEQIKSEVADIKNTGGRQGGAETAGAFLSNFVGDKPWVHVDIAGTAWTQPTTTKKDYLGKGSTGFGTRLLVEFVSQMS